MQHLANTGAARNPTAQIPSGQITLEGELSVPPDAMGVVLFAHGSGSSRHSPRNQFVARTIRWKKWPGWLRRGFNDIWLRM